MYHKKLLPEEINMLVGPSAPPIMPIPSGIPEVVFPVKKLIKSFTIIGYDKFSANNTKLIIIINFKILTFIKTTSNIHIFYFSTANLKANGFL